MEFKDGDIYINDTLAWRNPDRSGVVRGVNARHINNELWINGQLVYTHPEEKDSLGSSDWTSTTTVKSNELIPNRVDKLLQEMKETLHISVHTFLLVMLMMFILYK